ncbi:MAG: nucleotidyltransferase domain-containing protein [Desulfobacterales bacterium]|nr:nucleotidyltransferase domain-containing protein [Desulfobacterales bacterium]
MKKPVSKIVRPSEKERALARLSKRYRLSAFYAFGSRAKEAAALVRRKSGKLARSDRDVDIAVLPDVQVVLSAREKVEISLELEELLGAPRVDLVILPEADPFLALDIVRGELLYANDLDRQARHELYVLRRAGDLIPFKKERIRMIMEEGAR